MDISSAFNTLFNWPRELFFTSPMGTSICRLSTIHPYFRHIFHDKVTAIRNNKLKCYLKKKSKCRLLELEGNRNNFIVLIKKLRQKNFIYQLKSHLSLVTQEFVAESGLEFISLWPFLLHFQGYRYHNNYLELFLFTLKIDLRQEPKRCHPMSRTQLTHSRYQSMSAE